jgi:hypothetical protein
MWEKKDNKTREKECLWLCAHCKVMYRCKPTGTSYKWVTTRTFSCQLNGTAKVHYSTNDQTREHFNSLSKSIQEWIVRNEWNEKVRILISPLRERRILSLLKSRWTTNLLWRKLSPCNNFRKKKHRTKCQRKYESKLDKRNEEREREREKILGMWCKRCALQEKKVKENFSFDSPQRMYSTLVPPQSQLQPWVESNRIRLVRITKQPNNLKIVRLKHEPKNLHHGDNILGKWSNWDDRKYREFAKGSLR